VEDLIKLALANRPDHKQLQIGLLNSRINIQGTNNALLPVLDVQAFYQGSGLRGNQNPLSTCPAGVVPTPSHEVDPSGVIIPGVSCTPAGQVPPTGFGDAFTDQFSSVAPDKGVVFNLTIPLGNRSNQATQIRSQLEYRQSQLALRSLENQISIQVRNDEFTVEQNRARVAAAQKARELAAQTLDAEQKKYNLGASTYLNVLSDERDLTQAESNLVSAMTNYAKSKVLLDKDTAQTLDRLNIKIDEAVTGEIKTAPVVPGTVVNPKAVEELSNPPQPPAPPKP
jgi:outer membrane protein TolC